MTRFRLMLVAGFVVIANASCSRPEGRSAEAPPPAAAAAAPVAAAPPSPGPPAWPDWLDARIKEYQAEEVWHFQHQGQPAYSIQSGCCDRLNPVFSASGGLICSPSGGETFDGDGKCPLAALADPGVRPTRIWPRATKPNDLLIAPPPDIMVARLAPPPSTLPAWLLAEIRTHEGQELWQFQRGGKPAYYIISGSGDGYHPVYDFSVAYVCSPNGGITGGGDEKCPATALADPGAPIIRLWPEQADPGEEVHVPPLDVAPARSE